jgi:hypothetical protein
MSMRVRSHRSTPRSARALSNWLRSAATSVASAALLLASCKAHLPADPDRTSEVSTPAGPSPAASPPSPPGSPPALSPAPTPPAPGTAVRAAGPTTLAFASPQEAAVITSKPGPAASGDSASTAQVVVHLVGSNLAAVDLHLDQKRAAHLAGPPWEATLRVANNGHHELEAIGRNEAGEEVVRVLRNVEVRGVVGGGCLDRLKAAGLRFKLAGPTKEIREPVLLEPIIDGVTFRAVGSAKPGALLVACELGLRLQQLAKLAAAQGFDEVRHLGIYNYRPMRNPSCIARNDCKLSQHAFATAIDIHDFRVAGKELAYSTETDWLINKAVPVCPGKPQGEADLRLHGMACAMHAQKIFNVILTPNYNALHRNHFHVDLTPASATIKGEDMGLDPADPELLDD